MRRLEAERKTPKHGRHAAADQAYQQRHAFKTGLQVIGRIGAPAMPRSGEKSGRSSRPGC